MDSRISLKDRIHNGFVFGCGKEFFQELPALLEQMDEAFTPKEASELFRVAIFQKSVSVDTLQLLLRYAPPWQDFFYLHPRSANNDLPVEALHCGRTDVLDWMLRLGVDPNRRSPCSLSLLEAAVFFSNRHPEVFLSLLRNPDLDIVFTELCFRTWATMFRLRQEGKLEPGMRSVFPALSCLAEGDREGAVRFLEMDAAELPRDAPPIPRGLQVEHAVHAWAWDLVQILCRRDRPLSSGGALRALRLIDSSSLHQGKRQSPNVFHAVDSIFSACPQLLRRRYPRRLLMLLCLCRSSGHVLDHFLPDFPGRYLTLWNLDGAWLDWLLWEDALDANWPMPGGLLERWAELPAGPRPALYRGCPLPGTCPLVPEAVRTYFSRCAILGAPRKGVLSPLARDALRFGSDGLIKTLFQPKGPFSDEDPGPLFAFAASPDCPVRSRAILFAVFPGHAGEEAYQL